MIVANNYSVLLQSAAAATLLYLIGLVIHRLYFHPLAKFPGPKLAAITRWYEAYYDIVQDGQYTQQIGRLHKQYGPIVRISPFELHVNDADFYETLFQQEGRWDKYAWTYDAFDVPNATVSTLDHYHHRKRRAAIQSYFSKAATVGRSDQIFKHVQKLQRRVKDHLNKPMELGAAISAMTADIATEVVLGQSINSLDLEGFNRHMTYMVQGLGFVWRLSKHFRFVMPMIKKIPPVLLEKLGDPNVDAFFSYLRTMKLRVHQLVAEHQTDKVSSSSPRNLVHVILDSSLPSQEKALLRVNDELDTVTGAAFETTAQTLRALVYYIYSNPRILRRIRRELQERPPATGRFHTWTELERLPYLSAVIMEGLRLAPGVASRTARIAPDRTLTYKHWTIPAGTPVSSTVMLMHLNEQNYKEPYEFHPERWSDTGKKENTRAFAPFSKGTRMCLGMNLAWAELYLTTAMLVSTFDFDLGDTSIDDVQYYSDQFILGLKSQHGVKATPSLYSAA